MITTDTIVALSTPTGEGALGIVRCSGPLAIDIVDRHIHNRSLNNMGSHQARLATFHQINGELIDECVITIFKGPRSYTGEDVVELACHGSSYILEHVIQNIIDSGARLAQPGEFSQRAFLHGKLDLSQAEAIADLIASKTRRQHSMAMRHMKGRVSNEMDDMRERLIKFASLIELENDFGEEDVEFVDRKELMLMVDDMLARLSRLVQSFKVGQAIKEGIAVAIAGQPNVGKSTLLNAMLQEDRAIVSDIPGTTRDTIEDQLVIDGLLFRMIDTAGIRETNDHIESLGISRSYKKIQSADIVLWMTEIDEDAHSIAASFRELEWSEHQRTIILLNKIDAFHACHTYDVEEAVSTLTGRTPCLAVSAATGKHIDLLKTLLVQESKVSDYQAGDLVISQLRHTEALQMTEKSLINVKENITSGLPSDLIALDIRHALHHIGTITGTISTDDLLNSIFRDFCIGK